jgi:hypothetical protein
MYYNYKQHKYRAQEAGGRRKKAGCLNFSCVVVLSFFFVFLPEVFFLNVFSVFLLSLSQVSGALLPPSPANFSWVKWSGLGLL